MRAVLADSFERIHRANLVCMGVLSPRLPQGWRPQELGLVPGDTPEIEWNPAGLTPHGAVRVVLRRVASGETLTGTATALLETAREVALVRAGG